jgi:hypothetical protein
MNKSLFVLLAVAGLLTTVNHSQAGLGWSYEECVQHYGETTSPNAKLEDGHIVCHFSAKGYSINTYFLTKTVCRIAYRREFTFDTPAVMDFLTANGPDADWKGPFKDDSDSSYRWYGIKDKAVAYCASLNSNSLAVLIWTKEDDDFVAKRATQEASGM